MSHVVVVKRGIEVSAAALFFQSKRPDNASPGLQNETHGIHVSRSEER